MYAYTYKYTGGYMFDELASPINEYVQAALTKLLTLPIARMLKYRRPWTLLSALNENIECITKIWNINMRKDLLNFVLEHDRKRGHGCKVEGNDLESAMLFNYSYLKDILCINGIYVNIFNKIANTSDIDDPSVFCIELLQFLEKFDKKYSMKNNKKGHNSDLTDPSTAATDQNEEVRILTIPQDELNQQSCAIEAIRTLVDIHTYTINDIIDYPNGISIIFSLLSSVYNHSTFLSTAKLIVRLCDNTEFVNAVIEYNNNINNILWKLLYVSCIYNHTATSYVWLAIDSFSVHPKGLSYLVEEGFIIHLLCIIFNIQYYICNYTNRSYAITLLSKFLWNPVRGSDASAMLRR